MSARRQPERFVIDKFGPGIQFVLSEEYDRVVEELKAVREDGAHLARRVLALEPQLKRLRERLRDYIAELERRLPDCEATLHRDAVVMVHSVLGSLAALAEPEKGE